VRALKQVEAKSALAFVALLAFLTFMADNTAIGSALGPQTVLALVALDLLLAAVAIVSFYLTADKA